MTETHKTVLDYLKKNPGWLTADEIALLSKVGTEEVAQAAIDELINQGKVYSPGKGLSGGEMVDLYTVNEVKR